MQEQLFETADTDHVLTMLPPSGGRYWGRCRCKWTSGRYADVDVVGSEFRESHLGLPALATPALASSAS